MKTNVSARADGKGRPSLANLAICGAMGLLAGCASEPSSVLVSAPPPPPPTSATPAATVYSSPTAPPATAVAPAPSPVGASSIVVMQAPPAPQQEVPSARPTADHVWVAGYWTWRNNQYQWMAGR